MCHFMSRGIGTAASVSFASDLHLRKSIDVSFTSLQVFRDESPVDAENQPDLRREMNSFRKCLGEGHAADSTNRHKGGLWSFPSWMFLTVNMLGLERSSLYISLVNKVILISSALIRRINEVFSFLLEEHLLDF